MTVPSVRRTDAALILDMFKFRSVPTSNVLYCWHDLAVYIEKWFIIMIKKILARALYTIMAFYLMSALGFSCGYSAEAISGKTDPGLTVDAVQAGLSWPWLVAEAITELRS